MSSYERLWRTAGGFFTDAPDSDYALAIIDGAFAKSLVIKLVRKVLVMFGHIRAFASGCSVSAVSCGMFQTLSAGSRCRLQVESEQFVGAIAETLEPRLRLSGEMSTLEKFKVGYISC